MRYKNYQGHIMYDDMAGVFHGHVVGLKDVITFQGTTDAELKQAFKDSVDDYLVWCDDLGEKPEESTRSLI